MAQSDVSLVQHTVSQDTSRHYTMEFYSRNLFSTGCEKMDNIGASNGKVWYLCIGFISYLTSLPASTQADLIPVSPCLDDCSETIDPGTYNLCGTCTEYLSCGATGEGDIMSCSTNTEFDSLVGVCVHEGLSTTCSGAGNPQGSSVEGNSITSPATPSLVLIRNAFYTQNPNATSCFSIDFPIHVFTARSVTECALRCAQLSSSICGHIIFEDNVCRVYVQRAAPCHAKRFDRQN